MEPNYNRFEEVSDVSIDSSNINIYKAKLREPVYDSEVYTFMNQKVSLLAKL